MKFFSWTVFGAAMLATAALPVARAGDTAAAAQATGHYKSFAVTMYCPVGTLSPRVNVSQRGGPAPALNLDNLAAEWASITSQVKVDKVYIETFRSMNYMPEEYIEPLKKFFTDRGVRIAGGLTLVYNDSGQFQTFSYANPEHRAIVKSVCEMTAHHFDEVILDDFFFYCTKTDADIAAKGDRSWTQYRLEAMRDASRNLVVGPAKAVNPNIKMVIKFPNWYEHFQGLGYDLEEEPRIFDGIYTGTETRDPLHTEQHLQPYESYQIIRYFENIKPGGNGGGWVDGYQFTVVDRYAEQLWDTVFAKAPEMMLFNFSQIQQRINAGERPWAGQPTSFNYDAMVKNFQPGDGGPAQPQMARVAGYALEQADKFVYKLGKPIGIKSYRPYQATGEDFLHNFLGMIGLPMDVYPTFPSDANTILLTEAAKYDTDIVKKIKAQLVAGKNVVVTSGLVKSLQGKGIEDICEVEYTGNKIAVTGFHGQGGTPIPDSTMDKPIIFPEIKFKTNDAWYVLAGVANGNGFPLLISDKYSRGTLYVWAIPDNYADLYAMPPSALALIRNTLTRDLPVRIEGPSQVALFEYDNDTFIVQNFAATEATVSVGVTGHTALRDLLTDAVLNAQAGGAGGRGRGAGRGANASPPRNSFVVTLPPHSYQAFAGK